MGCDTLVSCPKCKVTIDCGYGSYRTFYVRAERGMAEHREHGAVSWSHDYAFREGDDLMVDGMPPKVLVASEKKFKKADYGDPRTNL